MKQTLTLTVLALCLLALSAPQSAAQRRGGAISAGKATATKNNIPAEVRDIGVSTGTPPKILGTNGGDIYDINAENGTSSNSRTPVYGSSSVKFVGLATAASGTLYGVSSEYGQSNVQLRSSIFSITPNNQFDTLSPPKNLTLNGQQFALIEGDLAYDKSANTMYATCPNSAGVWQLATINLSTGAVTFKGQLPAAAGPYGPPAYTALAFSPIGELYTLDTVNRILYKLNKTNASFLETKTLTGLLSGISSGTNGGMGFTATGGLVATFGGKLVSINVSDGTAGVVGNSSYSALVVSGGSGPVIHQ